MATRRSAPRTAENFAAVLREIMKEMGRRHLLSGRILGLEARFEASDDVIVRLVDGGFALVHPTWSGKAEPAPWPGAILLGDATAATLAIADWERDW